MLNQFKPTWMIESIYNLTPDELKANGIKAILTDLDNTLIAWNNPSGTQELRQWLNQMKTNQIPVIVVSNNNYERVEKAVQRFDLPFVARALKPFKTGIKKALKEYQLQPDEVVMVGDQMLTDVLAANRMNIRSILVKPLMQTDAWNTRINRLMECKIQTQLAKKENFEIQWRNHLDD